LLSNIAPDIKLDLARMHLYIKSSSPLEDVASQVSLVALRGFESELRDGLNLGGGEYFKFAKDSAEVILVCNDAEHAEVFVEARSEFPYYCYVWRGADSLLEEMLTALSREGITCELAHEE
jgi:hypothetical protein